MMQIHVSGRLVRDPAQKTSGTGRSYVAALMTVNSGDSELLVTVIVFNPNLQVLLTSLKKGDSLSAIGSSSIRTYTDKEGRPAASVTLMVNRLMTMAEEKATPRPKGDVQHPQSAGPRERQHWLTVLQQALDDLGSADQKVWRDAVSFFQGPNLFRILDLSGISRDYAPRLRAVALASKPPLIQRRQGGSLRSTGRPMASGMEQAAPNT